jgi:peptide/nickel transport system substrate-binding protein
MLAATEKFQRGNFNMKLENRLRRLLLSVLLMAAAIGGGLATPAQAQELRIATSYKLMTLDPHYANLNENTSLLSHIYERLVYQDEQLKLRPGLAISWKALSDTRWEFKLRENVRFHDGSAFTAGDVIYSIERIRDVLKPPSGGFQSYVSEIKSVSAPDPLTVIVETKDSAATLPLAFSSIFIMPKPPQGFRTTEELDAGTPPIGTGPYKFVSWSSGEMLKLARNDDYWGGKPAWPTVTFRVVESPTARVAALTTGEVDVADSIPARDVEPLKQRGVKIESVGAARVNFLQFDIASETLPGVTSKSGEAIANPFKKPLVRKALAMATDRGILADKILSGYGTPASQLFPAGLPGTSSHLVAEPPKYDEAKALLAKAGYPDGFNLVLAGPAGRYPGDGETLQAVAQNWARIGVNVQPTAAPFSVFNTKRAAGEYAVWYGGCSGESVDIMLDALLASPDPGRSTGALNYGNYRNEAFDEMLAKAESLHDGPERNKALADATDFVMADQPIIPLYHFHYIVGHGKRVASYVMHPRGWTTAMQTIPATE